MVSTGKPENPNKAKPTTANTDAKPAIPASVARTSLPPLTPVNVTQPAAPNVQPAAPAAVPTTSEKPAAPASADLQPTAAPAPASASKPVSSETKPAAAPASPAKPVEKLGAKLRKRDEILNALRAGGKIEKVDGLFRIVNADGTKNATSKRRILSLGSQKLLVASADGNSFTLDADADKKAQEPKPVAATKPATEATK